MLSKEAIDRLVELGQPATVEVNGAMYSTRTLSPIRRPEPLAVMVSSLTSLVDYIENGVDGLVPEKATIVVEQPGAVYLASHIERVTMQRACWVVAKLAHDVFPFGQFIDQETFAIQLQTAFVQSPELKELARVCGALTGEDITTSMDDGVSQSVSSRAGIHLKERVTIPNPIILRPYRTFREVEQPESMFILRVKKSSYAPQLALFEADGGVWKVDAVQKIAAFLREKITKPVSILA